MRILSSSISSFLSLSLSLFYFSLICGWPALSYSFYVWPHFYFRKRWGTWVHERVKNTWLQLQSHKSWPLVITSLHLFSKQFFIRIRKLIVTESVCVLPLVYVCSVICLREALVQDTCSRNSLFTPSATYLFFVPSLLFLLLRGKKQNENAKCKTRTWHSNIHCSSLVVNSQRVTLIIASANNRLLPRICQLAAFRWTPLGTNFPFASQMAFVRLSAAKVIFFGLPFALTAAPTVADAACECLGAISLQLTQLTTCLFSFVTKTSTMREDVL